MPTEAQKDWIRADVARRIGVETNEGFAKRAGVDPQTLGDFLAGRRWPRRSTIDKIEEALGLTPGTLAASGEDASTAPAFKRPGDLSDAELVTELSYRLEHANRMAERFRDEAAAAADDAALGRRLRTTRDHWIDLAERSDDEWAQHLASEVNHLRERCAEGHGEPGEETILAKFEDTALLLALAEDLGYELHNRQPDAPPLTNPHTLARAARHANSQGKRQAKLHDQLGEEPQEG